MTFDPVRYCSTDFRQMHWVQRLCVTSQPIEYGVCTVVTDVGLQRIKQGSLTLRISVQGVLILAGWIALAATAQPRNAIAQTDQDLKDELVRNMAACAQWNEKGCRASCMIAYDSFSDDVAGDPDAIADCRMRFAAAEARGNTAGRRSRAGGVTELSGEMRSKLADCQAGRTIDEGKACANVCAAATSDLGDKRMVEECRGAHARLQAALAGPVPKAERLAALPRIQAYCQSKVSQANNARTRRNLQVCAMECSSDQLSGKPESLQKTMLNTCETYYARYRELLGD